MPLGFSWAFVDRYPNDYWGNVQVEGDTGNANRHREMV